MIFLFIFFCRLCSTVAFFKFLVSFCFCRQTQKPFPGSTWLLLGSIWSVKRKGIGANYFFSVKRCETLAARDGTRFIVLLLSFFKTRKRRKVKNSFPSWSKARDNRKDGMNFLLCFLLFLSFLFLLVLCCAQQKRNKEKVKIFFSNWDDQRQEEVGRTEELSCLLLIFCCCCCCCCCQFCSCW